MTDMLMLVLFNDNGEIKTIKPSRKGLIEYNDPEYKDESGDFWQKRWSPVLTMRKLRSELSKLRKRATAVPSMKA